MDKSLATLAAAAIMSLGSSSAFAQGRTIELSPEVAASFQVHVTSGNMAPATVNFELAAGATVPEYVALNLVPPEIIEGAPELEGHEFFIANGQILVVGPETREIVTIIN